MKFKLEILIQILVLYSVGMYIAELEWGKSENSLQGHRFFLWSERTVAAIFTIEYLCRLFFAKEKVKYVLSIYSIIDLIAILPFYLGFMVDLRSLRFIRTMRLLRVLKFTRYNSSLTHVFHCFYKIKKELQIIGALIVFFLIFGATAIVEAERAAQPDKFASVGDGLWWAVVTLTTVGYGDSFPVTTTGRCVAIILIMSGLGIFGTFVSLVGSAFVEAVKLEREHNGLEVTLSPTAVSALKGHAQWLGRGTDRTSLINLADAILLDHIEGEIHAS